MKNIIILFIIVILLPGCDKDFLERYPTDQPVSEVFWKNKNDAYMALIGVYSRLYLEPNATRFRLEMLTDNAYSFPQLEQEFKQIIRGILQPTTGGPVTSWYANSYTSIASCNFFLGNIDRIVDIDVNLKKQYTAEVRVLRAWFYFLLQQCYGGVIIYEKTPTVEDSKIKQSTSEDVIKFILDDLNAAIPDLPNEKYKGRIVKNTAHALKAKVLLHTNKWAEAAAEANIVINSGICSLYPNYRDLFLLTGQANDPSELLFTTVYSSPNRFHRGGNDHLVYATTKPRRELLNAYLCIDGLPTNQSPMYNPNDPYVNRDPRCLQTINVTGKRIIDGVTWVYTSDTGIHWNKFVEDNISYHNYAADLDYYDIVHLRYADVLLMYAEAQNEAVGPDQSVYNAINEVRKRSDMPDVTSDLSKENMRETIRLERRIELAGEGHRWFDLKRWGIANEVLMTVDEPGSGNVLQMPPHQYLWPFPITETDLNPNLVQNPGYN